MDPDKYLWTVQLYKLERDLATARVHTCPPGGHKGPRPYAIHPPPRLSYLSGGQDATFLPLKVIWTNYYLLSAVTTPG